MSENLFIPESATKAEKYEAILPQIEALISDEPDLYANLANISAALKEAFSFFWVGFYLVKETQLVLGPFQGPVACTRISMGMGVCGSAWQEGKTFLVPNVDEFPGHIACNSASKSEIVIPVFKGGIVAMVLDVDSDKLDDFDSVDQEYLERLIKILETKI